MLTGDIKLCVSGAKRYVLWRNTQNGSLQYEKIASTQAYQHERSIRKNLSHQVHIKDLAAKIRWTYMILTKALSGNCSRT